MHEPGVSFEAARSPLRTTARKPAAAVITLEVTQGERLQGEPRMGVRLRLLAPHTARSLCPVVAVARGLASTARRPSPCVLQTFVARLHEGLGWGLTPPPRTPPPRRAPLLASPAGGGPLAGKAPKLAQGQTAGGLPMMQPAAGAAGGMQPPFMGMQPLGAQQQGMLLPGMAGAAAGQLNGGMQLPLPVPMGLPRGMLGMQVPGLMPGGGPQLMGLNLPLDYGAASGGGLTAAGPNLSGTLSGGHGDDDGSGDGKHKKTVKQQARRVGAGGGAGWRGVPGSHGGIPAEPMFALCTASCLPPCCPARARLWGRPTKLRGSTAVSAEPLPASLHTTSCVPTTATGASVPSAAESRQGWLAPPEHTACVTLQPC